MTIEETKKYWEYKYNRAKDYSDVHWEADERHEHQEYVEALQIAVKVLKENAELKRLLRLAVNDFEIMGNEVYYKGCDFDFRCKLCPFHCYSGGCSTKWRYTNEVLNLIGDDK